MSEPVPGIVVVDKPAGWTSHDVVGRLRRLAGTRKVGHAGTLDPMATGVLLAGVGRATRLLGHLQLTDKEYLATVRLGESTVTDDAEGEVVASTSATHLDEATVRAAMAPLTGDIEQVPSAVSAVKVDGKRSYARVRAGEDVDLPARPVKVSTFEATAFRPGGELLDVDVRVVCSSGTYVRALARDLGAALGVGGHLTMLRRTRVGGFDLSVAHTLEELETAFAVVPLDDVARRTFPVLELDADQATDVRYGRALPGVSLGADGPVALLDPDGHFLALYEQRGSDAKPIAVFV
ncbi:tRNA pseudouridine(55) synthase TruB [Aeromicrobium terrae]|uniref:tRNA pseudouridine synthase B n=1 Tax=Aeromicrobium terrae TaxID=2498846 RepID=A0A5C8NQZ4_9ACTN|nr:tRNA pseudouridine(55) synthase TruB [Aeromicrobium terrae]TXL63301.1 tRNA pseudouridine(55) synthase TruB [Aeromicrobium terrae]